jgi:hypothetical protein
MPLDGAEGAVGVEAGRAGASARAAEVDMSGERGGEALEPRSPRLPGVPVQPWPLPGVGRAAAGEDGALPPAFGAPPPIGAACCGVDDGELSGVRDGACGASAWVGASIGGATEDWTVWPVVRIGAGASGVDDV